MKDDLKELFTPKGKKPTKPTKIFVGNARINELNSDVSLDLTAIANHLEYARGITINNERHYEITLTVIPFKQGVNKFGNTHYVIIKNK